MQCSGVLGRSERRFARVQGAPVLEMLGPVAEFGIAGEDLLPRRRQRHDQIPQQWKSGNPRPFQQAHLDHDHGHHRQRDGREQLVGDAEQREEGVDAAQRIGDAHQQDRSPCGDHHDAAHPGADLPARVMQAPQRAAQVAQTVGQHEPGHPGAGIDGRQDEQRLEHDREVIPESFEPAAAEHRKHLSHTESQGGGAAGARDDRLLTHTGRRVGDVRRGDRRPRQAELVDVGGRSPGGATGGRRRGVHDEVQMLVEDRRGDQRHDRNERFGQHSAVADQAHLAFLLQKLRSGAGGDQRVETRQSPARDGDEQEGEQRAGEHRSGTGFGELRDRRGLHHRPGQQDADGQQCDGADLHERRQVVARRQQQPHRQYRGGQTVDDQAPRQRHLGQREPLCAPVGVGDPAAGRHRQQQQRHPDQGHLRDPAGPQEAQIQAHEESDRNRHRDGENAPRAFGERVDDHKAQHRQQDDHDHQHPDDRRRSADSAEFVARHLAQRAPAPTGRDGQHQIVLHTPGQHRADDDPDGAREVTHLGGQHRTHQRAGSGNRREVMAEEHPTVGRHVVGAVLVDLGRGRMVVARLDDLHLDQPGIEPVPDDVCADRRDDEPHRVDRLPAHESDEGPGDRAQHGHCPEDQPVAHGDRGAVDDRDRWQVFVGSDERDVAADVFDVALRRGGV